MLAASMRLGASQALIERYLHSALTGEQREALMRMVDAVQLERVRGLDIHTVVLDVPTYVDGLSVIAHKLMELINAEVLLQVVGMEDRVFVTARSRAGSVDVGASAARRRWRRSRPGGVGRDPRLSPQAGARADPAGPVERSTWAGYTHGRGDHEPARPLHRRRHPRHRGPRHRPALRPFGHLRA